MNVGTVTVGDLLLAPMAGYGDIAFRRLCREEGAALTTTEMVSVKGLLYRNEKTERLLRLAENESPSCVQLFGHDPEDFYAALQFDALAPFDIIDINMGCPVPKVTKCGEGSALLGDAGRAADIVRACVSAAHGRPVTVKIRLGRTDDAIVAPAFAARMQEAGAAAVTVHGRTASRGYGGKADWTRIAEVVKSVSVPVIGNGDVRSREEAELRMAQTGCAAVAVGRGALGRPDIFRAGVGDTLLDLILRHLRYALLYFDERTAVLSMRKHLHCYLSGIPDSRDLRYAVNATLSAAALEKILIARLRV